MIIYVARVHLKKFTILCTRPWTLHFERWTQHHRSLGIRWVTTPLTHQAKFIISTPKKGRFLFTMGLLDWIAHCTYMCVTERSTRHAWPDGRIWRVHVLKKKKKGICVFASGAAPTVIIIRFVLSSAAPWFVCWREKLLSPCVAAPRIGLPAHPGLLWAPQTFHGTRSSTLRASFKIFLRGLWALEDLTTPDLLIKIKVVLSHVWLYLRSNNTPGGRFCKRFLDQLFFSSEQIAEQMFGRILTQKPLSPAFSHKL